MKKQIWTSVFLCNLFLLASCTKDAAEEKVKTEEAVVAKAEPAVEKDLYEIQDQWPGACQRSKEPDERQSPIPLADDLFKGAKAGGLKLAYKPSDVTVVDNGHTLVFKFDGDAGHLEMEGKKYALKQFHFHEASEHTLNGKSYPMEIHFVHLLNGKDGKVSAVALGFLVEPGKASSDWTKTWASIPEKTASASAPAEAHGQHGPDKEITKLTKFNARSLIPKKQSYLVYEGSLTTPNCDEFVTHAVSAKPISLDQAQIEKFASYHKVSNRGLQPLGDAKVRKYRKVAER